MSSKRPPMLRARLRGCRPVIVAIELTMVRDGSAGYEPHPPEPTYGTYITGPGLASGRARRLTHRSDA
jgi:hypothetical protein